VMGECDKCRAHVAADPRGKAGLYIDHVGALCQYAAERGARPMIWGDMLKSVESADAYAAFPRGTVIFDWEYYGRPKLTSPWRQAATAAGLEVWGASAVMCSHSAQSLSLLPDYASRLKNLLAWHEVDGPVLHTTWGRPSNTWPLYCPWPSLVPLFAAAGGEKAWAAHPWRKILPLLGDRELFLPPDRLAAARAAVEALVPRNALERETRRYVLLALRHQELLRQRLELSAEARAMAAAVPFVGDDKAALRRHIMVPREAIDRQTDEWESDMRAFFADNELADADEFLAERRTAMM